MSSPKHQFESDLELDGPSANLRFLDVPLGERISQGDVFRDCPILDRTNPDEHDAAVWVKGFLRGVEGNPDAPLVQKSFERQRVRFIPRVVVVVTNECDIRHDAASFVVVAPIITKSEYFQSVQAAVQSERERTELLGKVRSSWVAVAKDTKINFFHLAAAPWLQEGEDAAVDLGELHTVRMDFLDALRSQGRRAGRLGRVQRARLGSKLAYVLGRIPDPLRP